MIHWLWLLPVAAAGAFLGVVLMSILCAASKADYEIERMKDREDT